MPLNLALYKETDWREGAIEDLPILWPFSPRLTPQALHRSPRKAAHGDARRSLKTGKPAKMSEGSWGLSIDFPSKQFKKLPSKTQTRVRTPNNRSPDRRLGVAPRSSRDSKKHTLTHAMCPRPSWDTVHCRSAGQGKAQSQT